MSLSILKPVVGCLPSSSGANGSRGNVPPATMLRLNSKISSSHTLQERGKEGGLQAQEAVTAVSRRDVMCIAAAGIALSLAKPAEAAEVANATNPFSQFVELLKEKVGLSKPKSEADGKKPKTESKTELPKPKTEGDGKKPPIENKAEPSKPKTEGDGKKPPVENKAEPSKPKTEGNEQKAELSKPNGGGDASKVKGSEEKAKTENAKN